MSKMLYKSNVVLLAAFLNDPEFNQKLRLSPDFELFVGESRQLIIDVLVNVFELGGDEGITTGAIKRNESVINEGRQHSTSIVNESVTLAESVSLAECVPLAESVLPASLALPAKTQSNKTVIVESTVKHENPAPDLAVIRQEVIETLIKHTGYPLDMLQGNQDLEGDLGLDTVKQMEILGDLSEVFKLPYDKQFRLSEVSTTEKMTNYLLAQIHNTKSNISVVSQAAH
jgi:hypothetical protein